MCKCKNVGIGTYENQVQLKLPTHMKKYVRKRRERLRLGSGADFIGVDACLADEIFHLWTRDITTTGCCCGHNKRAPYIGVAEESIPLMEHLGYKVQYNPFRPKNKDTFWPKRTRCTLRVRLHFWIWVVKMWLKDKFKKRV